MKSKWDDACVTDWIWGYNDNGIEDNQRISANYLSFQGNKKFIENFSNEAVIGGDKQFW